MIGQTESVDQTSILPSVGNDSKERGTEYENSTQRETDHPGNLIEGFPHVVSDLSPSSKSASTPLSNIPTVIAYDDIVRRDSLEEYTVHKIIGAGRHGGVMLAERKNDGCIHALKVMKKMDRLGRLKIDHIETEIAVLQTFQQHPFVVSLHESFQTEINVYLALEYVPGGDLYYHMSQKQSPFSENEVKFFVAELVICLEALHENKIMYGDLKPENIMLDARGNVKLIDFSLSRKNMEISSGASSVAGTLPYLAPEVLMGTGYGYAIDFWALGAVTYELLFGLPPWYSQDQQIMKETKLNGASLMFPKKTVITNECKSFISKCLKRDIIKRLDSSKAKSHAFLNGMDFEILYKREEDGPFLPIQDESALDASNFDDTEVKPFDETPTAPLILPTITNSRAGVNGKMFTNSRAGVDGTMFASKSAKF